MNAATNPPPNRLGRGTLAVMATVLNVALLIFVFGFLSLILDRSVIEEPDAGPLVGPLMVVVASAVVLWMTARPSTRGLLARALSAALAVLIGAPLVGAFAYSAVRGELGVIVVFFGRHLLSPFALASAIVAASVVAAAGLVDRAR